MLLKSMQHQEIVDALKAVTLFASLSQRFLQGIAKACTERTFEPGDVIVKQGNPGIGLFVIVEGKVKIVKTSESGERLELATHGPGEVIGEMSVLDGANRSADVVAVDQTLCLVLSAWDFKSFMESHPEVALDILPVVVKRFRETNTALTGQ
jgi:CRP/FNR family transcriptional regulator, cyclic AMP receptor protein